MKHRPDIDEIRSILDLDAETGALRWKQKIAKKVVVGAEAGRPMSNGYKRIQIDKVRLLAHHVVFALTHNYWPSEIDHINNDPSDNRPCNLREVTRSQNNWNTRKPTHNTSGVKGVFKQRSGVTWTVRLKCYGKLYRVGKFPTAGSASEFLDLFRSMAHGEFANSGAY
jgi:hypothetical protein